MVPNATVKATNIATNITVETRTNNEGDYTLPFLIPGSYNVTAGAAGFKTARKDNLELRIHEGLQLDFAMEVGAITDQVQVIAAG